MSDQVEAKIVSGDTATLAKRYADALYALGEDGKSLDILTEDLRKLRLILQDSAEFKIIAQHPRLNRQQLVSAAQSLTTAAGLNTLTGNFLGLLGRNRRLNIVAAVIDCFLAAIADRRGEHSAVVRTAFPLDAAQQEQLAARLQELAGGKVHLSVTEDRNLIGGFTAHMGSRLIDASVRSKLQRLERQLKSGQAA